MRTGEMLTPRRPVATPPRCRPGACAACGHGAQVAPAETGCARRQRAALSRAIGRSAASGCATRSRSMRRWPRSLRSISRCSRSARPSSWCARAPLPRWARFLRRRDREPPPPRSARHRAADARGDALTPASGSGSGHGRHGLRASTNKRRRGWATDSRRMSCGLKGRTKRGCEPSRLRAGQDVSVEWRRCPSSRGSRSVRSGRGRRGCGRPRELRQAAPVGLAVETRVADRCQHVQSLRRRDEVGGGRHRAQRHCASARRARPRSAPGPLRRRSSEQAGFTCKVGKAGGEGGAGWRQRKARP